MTHAQATARPEARLLSGYQVLGRPADLDDHLRTYGSPPLVRGGDGGHAFIRLIDAAGLTGRGGGAFPTGRKLWAVAAGRRPPVVVVNAAEGEPASGKDRLLLAVAPHLVLDGATLAAAALDATEIIVGVHGRSGSVPGLERALAQRRRAHLSVPGSGLWPVPARVHVITGGYVESEESALVNGITNGDPRPTAVPPRPYERGVDGRPTLVLNAETYAHIALIARYGPEWFRSRGTADAPGTALFTLGGAVARPGVVEAPLGTTAGDLILLAGGPSEPLQAVLTGGYGGAWMPVGALGTPATPSAFAAAGAVLGPGIILAFPARSCGLAETARVLRWLAGQNAGQCGPCVFGLPAVAADLTEIARGMGGPAAYERLERRLAVIGGRGACRHPDGAVRFARSALRVFRSHLPVHEHVSVCLPARRAPVLPLPLGW